jgi:hypothetical protein
MLVYVFIYRAFITLATAQPAILQTTTALDAISRPWTEKLQDIQG